VGRLLPKRTSQGAFLVTCFFSFLHHKDWKVRQLPSRASILAKSLYSHSRSQNSILLELTPALFAILSPALTDRNQKNMKNATATDQVSIAVWPAILFKFERLNRHSFALDAKNAFWQFYPTIRIHGL
jgi:hypothetical protein